MNLSGIIYGHESEIYEYCESEIYEYYERVQHTNLVCLFNVLQPKFNHATVQPVLARSKASCSLIGWSRLTITSSEAGEPAIAKGPGPDPIIIKC